MPPATSLPLRCHLLAGDSTHRSIVSSPLGTSRWLVRFNPSSFSCLPLCCLGLPACLEASTLLGEPFCRTDDVFSCVPNSQDATSIANKGRRSSEINPLACIVEAENTCNIFRGSAIVSEVEWGLPRLATGCRSTARNCAGGEVVACIGFGSSG